VASNEKEGVCYRQPRALADRLAIARDFVHRMEYTIPIAVDPMDNRADEIYAGWPERFYIIDEAGTIVFKGKPGPFGYKPEEVEAWLEKRWPAGAGVAGSR